MLQVVRDAAGVRAVIVLKDRSAQPNATAKSVRKWQKAFRWIRVTNPGAPYAYVAGREYLIVGTGGEADHTLLSEQMTGRPRW